MSDELMKLTDIYVKLGDAPILDGLGFDIMPGEILGLVGESGSGKSMTALTIMDLLPEGIRKTDGTLVFEGRDLDSLTPTQRRRLLGKEIAMVFQDPMTSLNPLYTVGHQLIEALRIHNPRISKKAALKAALERLEEVEIPDPESAARKYPHQFSGGQRQRICIAMALMNSPRLLIADEATTALDVTVQYHILELLRRLSKKHNMALLVISHNLALIAHLCRRVLVLYTGMILEEGTVAEVLKETRHPYTAELLQSMPENAVKGEPIHTIPGRVPSLFEPKKLCPFYDRCPHAKPECLEPPLERFRFSETHYSRCQRSREIGELLQEEVGKL